MHAVSCHTGTADAETDPVSSNALRRRRSGDRAGSWSRSRLSTDLDPQPVGFQAAGTRCQGRLARGQGLILAPLLAAGWPGSCGPGSEGSFQADRLLLDTRGQEPLNEIGS